MRSARSNEAPGHAQRTVPAIAKHSHNPRRQCSEGLQEWDNSHCAWEQRNGDLWYSTAPAVCAQRQHSNTHTRNTQTHDNTAATPRLGGRQTVTWTKRNNPARCVVYKKWRLGLHPTPASEFPHDTHRAAGGPPMLCAPPCADLAACKGPRDNHTTVHTSHQTPGWTGQDAPTLSPLIQLSAHADKAPGSAHAKHGGRPQQMQYLCVGMHSHAQPAGQITAVLRPHQIHPQAVAVLNTRVCAAAGLQAELANQTQAPTQNPYPPPAQIKYSSGHHLAATNRPTKHTTQQPGSHHHALRPRAT
jgi:hypothetical protein